MTELLYTLVLTHITIVCVTLYLHRGQTHRAIAFHPILSHFMRAWLWFTTGMVTKQWVAIHRKHHSATDSAADPHSPATYGILRVLFGGAMLYHAASRDRLMVQQFGAGTPDDWMERNIYSRYSRVGIVIMLALNLVLFGAWGLLIWGVQMIWIPFWAAGVVNGIGHWWGYRNTDTKDRSRNIMPWGVIIGGEELHNNHHADPASAKLSHKAWEFDSGWAWLTVFRAFGLATLAVKHP